VPWIGTQAWGWMGSMMGVWGFMGYAPPPREDAGLRILRERYARGEIDHEEYERMRDHLRD
jgi:hypothetical protein